MAAIWCWRTHSFAIATANCEVAKASTEASSSPYEEARSRRREAASWGKASDAVDLCPAPSGSAAWEENGSLDDGSLDDGSAGSGGMVESEFGIAVQRSTMGKAKWRTVRMMSPWSITGRRVPC